MVVPDGRGILQRRPDKGFVGPFFPPSVLELLIFTFRLKESLVGFVADVIYMLVPVELSVDGDPEVLS